MILMSWEFKEHISTFKILQQNHGEKSGGVGACL